ncbi:MAG: ATP-binding protein [Deltaproteobacteria bacterium]|nr:ATP-binding protein [Deltaproteobacteria bacterium]
MTEVIKDNDGNEDKRRHREYYLIFALIPVIAALAYFESNIVSFGGNVPVATNILVLGLININILFLILLIFLILRNAFKLYMENKLRFAGSRLKTKVVGSFVGLTIVPTLLLFFVVIGLVNKSIDAWFDIKVEDSLQESLDLARAFHKDTSDKVLNASWRMASDIEKDMAAKNGVMDRAFVKSLIDRKLVDQYFSTIEVYSSKSKRVAYAVSGNVSPAMVPDIEAAEIEKAVTKGAHTFVQTLHAGEVIRGVSPINFEKGAAGAVAVTYFMPQNLVEKMGAIATAFEGYKQLQVMKNPVKVTYFTVLLALTLLIVFFAIWIGQSLAKSITGPILELAEGTNAIAGGNLDYRIKIESRDEIGQLVKSFNRMTEDLKAGKAGLESANMTLRDINLELDSRRRYIEVVLDDIPSGVVSIDRGGTITSINRIAAEMLWVSEHGSIGKDYNDVFRREDAEVVGEMIKEMNELGVDSIERQMKVNVKDKGEMSVLVHLSALKSLGGEYLGMVAVLDDLTHMLKTQRMLAWKEVAKRIAHEIKNPLTPIQLSAQRLRKKYLGTFPGDVSVFDECTQTIIRQVEELKILVNEFSSFARMPAANPVPNDLNAIIDETVILYRGAHKGVAFDFVPDNGVPVMDIDKDQFKRMLINLFDNSVDAMGGSGSIRVTTVYDVAISSVRLEVADTGPGIPDEDKPRLFEPYFSTKKTGTGLGLAIVSNIISDHNGYIRVRDNSPKGTVFSIELPVKARA